MDKGFVESFEVGGGFTFLQGWLAINPELPGHLTVVSSGQTLGREVLTDLWIRPDLADPLTVRRAFRCLIPTKGGVPSENPLVWFDQEGRSFDLPLLHQPKAFVAKGYIECLNDWGLAGWGWHPSVKGAGIQIDDGPLLTIPLDRTRSDLPQSYLTPKQNAFELAFGQLNMLARSYDTSISLRDGKPRVAKLHIANEMVAQVTFSSKATFLGKVERFENNILSGWACNKHAPEESVFVDVCIGGTRFVTVEANHPRNDLIRKGLVKKGGGFRVLLPPNLNGSTADREISVRFHLNGNLVTGARYEVGQRQASTRTIDFWENLPASPPAISIIVPIFNAAESLARCLSSLSRYTSGRARLILIDDASPQASVKTVLSRYADYTNVHILTNDTNIGFTKTINRGIAYAEQDDVVLLNSDTEVTPGWLEHLFTAAYHSKMVGTVTPLSDNAGAFSVPEINVKNMSLTLLGHEQAARTLTTRSQMHYPRVPTGNGFCMYIKRYCIDVIGSLDDIDFPIGYGEENDFCQRAQRVGFSNIVDDRTLVFHERSASFLDQKTDHYTVGRQRIEEKYPEYGRQIRVFQEGRSLQEMRWNARRAVNLRNTSAKKRVLYVIATETGGTPQTNRDLMTVLSPDLEPYILRCNSRQIFLSQFGIDKDALIEEHELFEDLELSIHASDEYNRIVADILVKHAIELVHIRHIAWHSLDLTYICKKLSIPVIFSFHDFYTVCPNIKLLDENRKHCAGRCTSSLGRCDAELWPKQSVPALKHRFVYRWREMQLECLQSCDAFVTTSPYAKNVLKDAFPTLDFEHRLNVIPHGRTFDNMETLAAPLKQGEPLRILVPGNISEAKGASLIRDVAAIDQGRTVEFHIVGDGGRLQTSSGIFLHGKYARDEIASKIANIRPHIGAVLSIWPETYCHTLSEMWSCGIPVVGMAIGAVGERIEETGAGWLVSPLISPIELLGVLQRLISDVDGLAVRISQVKSWQTGIGQSYTSADMGVRYLELYQRVFDTRLAFKRKASDLR